MRRAIGVFAIALLMEVALVGCSKPNPSDSRSTATPPALGSETSLSSASRKAKTVWDAYSRVSERLLAEPDLSVDLVKPYVTDSEFKAIEEQVREFRADKNILHGKLSSRGFNVTRESSGQLTALVCVDNTKSSITNDDDDFQDSRAADFTLRLEYTIKAGTLQIDEDRVWTDSSVC